MNKLANRIVLLSVLVFSFFITTNAQVSVSGTVKQTNGSSVSGASVTVKGSNKGTVSDNAGNYKIVVTQQASVVIEISSVGFEPLVKTVELKATEVKADFILKDAENSLGTLVVTATNSKRIQQAMPLSITSFSESKIQKVKFNSNADLLRGVPGITAEGGGGEVAANIFVRGLPSGGQYQFSPLQVDGMPVVSTMGLNSSAPDVYFRNDAGISKIEFVRGGSATLYGAGSVAGIINFSSKTGGDIQKTMIETEYATPGKAKFDFNTGGPIADKLYYNLSGTYRYDNGPIKSGIPSNGYQFRGNIKKVMENGSFTVFAQYINDQAQFYSPYHLTADRTLPTGWDGEKINTMLTSDVANLTVRTPNGFYQSRGGKAVTTNGGYIMAAFDHNFANDWKFSVKLRSANYKHEFNFFNTDGNGRNPLSQTGFLTAVAPTGSSPVYTYASDNTPVSSKALILENIIVDRNRPLNELAGNMNITKTINGKSSKHVLNLGAFLSTTNAIDYNVQIRYLSEFRNNPRILNMSYTNAASVLTNYTTNGVVSAPGYTNRNITSNRKALYFTDEMTFGKLIVDLGVRFEGHRGAFIVEKTTAAANADGRTVAWGNGSYDRFNLSASDWAVALGTSYQLKKELNVYANFSRGYFFPEYRGYTVKYKAGVPVYPEEKPEHVVQGELGLKFSNSKLTATIAGYSVSLKDRFAVNLVSIGGVLKETQSLQSSIATGIEFTYDWEIAKSFHFAGTGTIQKATYTSFLDSSTATPIDNTGKWLERQPRVMFSPSLAYDNKKFYAAFSMDYVGKRYGNAANLVELNAYTLGRFDAAYTFKMKNEETLRVGAGIFNVFNTEAVTEGNPRAGNTQTNTGDFFVGRVSLPRAFYVRLALSL